MNAITTAPNTLRIATRGSMLALWQARHVASLLEARGSRSELNVIKTTGDKVQDRFLHEIGGKGLFIKELEDALASRQADLAVHSLKDLPAAIPQGFKLAAVLPRHSVVDVMIFRAEVASTLGLSQTGAPLDAEGVAGLGPLVIASASLRRTALLKQASPRLKVVPVRGNVDTRLRKLDEGQFDAIILAGASLERLGIKTHVTRALAPDWFVPCAGQGALAIETRSDAACAELVATLGCATTTRCVSVEREVLRMLGGDCTMPFGCLAVEKDKKIHVQALVCDNTGGSARATWDCAVASWPGTESAAREVVGRLRAAGVEQILENLGLGDPPGQH
jgi:hydroxymethylbilane synthase